MEARTSGEDGDPLEAARFFSAVEGLNTYHVE
jgi:hypothetical protein